MSAIFVAWTSRLVPSVRIGLIWPSAFVGPMSKGSEQSRGTKINARISMPIQSINQSINLLFATFILHQHNLLAGDLCKLSWAFHYKHSYYGGFPIKPWNGINNHLIHYSVYYLHVWTNFGTFGLLYDMQNNANFRNFKLIMARHYSWLLITTPLVELTPSDIVAPCIRKEIRIPESGKFFLLELGILGFGIRNRVQGIKISVKTGIRNPSSTDEKSGIPGTWNQEATAWNP